MSPNRSSYQLQLFTLRLWSEKLDGERWEWQGEVRNTTTGERHYFRNWQVLADLMSEMLPQGEQAKTEDHGDSDGL